MTTTTDTAARCPDCNGRTAPFNGGGSFCPRCERLCPPPAEARATTDFNRDALALLAALRSALGRLDTFLEAHEEGCLCGCDHCSYWPETSGPVLKDLIGLRWALDIGTDLLDGQVLHPFDVGEVDAPVVVPG